jgi:hypothetical protein
MVAGSLRMSSDKGRKPYLMKTILAAITAVGLVCLAAACGAEEQQYPTNLELIGQAVKKAADSMEIAPPVGREPHLTIDAGQGNDASWLLDSVLKEHLLGLGWKIQANSKDTDSAGAGEGYLLKMRIADLSLQYGRSWRRYVFAGKVVERVARVSFYYELIHVADDRVVVSSNVGAESRDVVPASALPALSNAKYSFASPQLEKGQWDRYLEGGLVIAIIGVLVYLFYSNKTAS